MAQFYIGSYPNVGKRYICIRTYYFLLLTYCYDHKYIRNKDHWCITSLFVKATDATQYFTELPDSV
jgi:hypothetical protein